MKISLPPKNYAEALLKWVPEFSSKEYFDMDSAIDAIKNNTMDWQPYFSISSYAYALLEHVSHIPDFGGDYKIIDGDKSLRRSVADSVLPTLMEFVKGLEFALDNSPYDEEMSRLLFHARLASGNLYLAKGDLLCATDALTKAIRMPYNVEFRRVNFWGGIERKLCDQRYGVNVPLTNDIAIGKLIAAFVIGFWFLKNLNFERCFVFHEIAALYQPSEFLFDLLNGISSQWIVTIINFRGDIDQNSSRMWKQAEEEKLGVSGLSLLAEDWNPAEQWMLLFHRLANIIIACRDDEEIGEEIVSPRECKRTSPNYWAWRLGQTVAIMWNNEERQFIDNLLELYEPGIESWQDGLPLLSLIAECDNDRDWESAQEYYLRGWRLHATRSVRQAFMEGPDSGVYWAMRVGLADGFITPPEYRKLGQLNANQLTAKDVEKSKIELTTQDRISFEDALNPVARADIDRVLAAKHEEMPQQKLVEHIDNMKADIMAEMEKLRDKVAPTHTRTKDKLIGDYGDWVNQLTNPGSLFNAEFMFETLNQRTWGEVSMGYANAVEAEVRETIIKPLRGFLLAKRRSALVSTGSKPIEVKDKMTLSDLEKVLCSVEEDRFLNEFTQTLGLEREFVVNELPRALSRLRGFRKGAAHGEPIAEAREIRRLVLGTPQKPGILKTLIVIRTRSSS